MSNAAILVNFRLLYMQCGGRWLKMKDQKTKYQIQRHVTNSTWCDFYQSTCWHNVLKAQKWEVPVEIQLKGINTYWDC